MSVFKVHLNTITQGYLDYNPATATPGFLGDQMQPSKQRTMWCAGPNRIYRELFDGQTFTDCNYWKRFDIATDPTYGFIEVLDDDGSVYSDIPGENTFPRIYSPYSVNSGDTFDTNFIDILGDLGGVAQFVQITNNGTSSPNMDIQIELNGSSDAVMTLAAGDTQVFNAGDLAITALAFDGGTSNTTLQIILSVGVVCNS